MTPALRTDDTTELRQDLPRGQRGLLRRYLQATARVERCRVAYVTAAAARSRYLAALRASGLSERQLGLLVGLSRAQVRAISAAATKIEAPTPMACTCGFTSPCPTHDQEAAS